MGATGSIRPARPAEALEISALALRSKGHWGYAPGFLEASRAELTLSAADLAARPVYVLERDGRIGGFYSLLQRPGHLLVLDHLYVEPAEIGRGLGRRLFAHAVSTARALGAAALEITADPHAEAFYRARGAVRVREDPSPVQPGRLLPVLRLAL
ncbi:MAG: GNAT family N-acetyltransferase [Myxococcales bacterium]